MFQKNRPSTARLMAFLWPGFLVIACSLLLSACARPIAQQHPHIIIDKEGYPVSDLGERMTPEAYRERIADIIREARKKTTHPPGSTGKPPRLLIMVHGGLISQADGLAYIDEMVGPDGYLKEMPGGERLYPVFINWDSSLTSALIDDLFLVRNGKRDPVFGVLSSPFIIVQRLVNGVVSLPVTLVHHYDTEKMQFEKWDEEHRTAGEVIRNTGISLVSLPITLAELPFLSGFGKGAWNMMSRRIDQMFAHQIKPRGPIYNKKPDLRPGALRHFFEEIEQERFRDDKGSLGSADVILVGHSMGAMVVNRILRDFPRLDYHRVVYMGAAASIDDFITTIPPYLHRNPETRFYGFSLSNIDEAGEFNWGAPRGSLLTWIDNIFEPGLSPTGKRVGFFRNRKAIRIRAVNGNEEVCDRMHFYKFIGEDGLHVPHKHGDFNNDRILQPLLQTTLTGDIHSKDLYPHDRVCILPMEVP